MIFNAASLLKQPIGTTQSYSVEENYPGFDEIEGDLSMVGAVNMLRTNRGILVTGTLQTVVKGFCSRCLEDMEIPLTLPIEEEYFPSIDIITGAPLEIPEDGTFVIDHNHILDLGEAVRQYIIMALPMKPLCRPDCAGLCPQCGANLNLGPCDCSVIVDPRWSKLGELALTWKNRKGG